MVRARSTYEITAVDKTEAAFRKVEGNMRTVERSVESVNRVLVSVAGAAGFGLIIKNTIKVVDEMGKFADRIGIGVGALSQLAYAAEISGVSVNTLETSLQRMVRRISEAAAGTGEAQAALVELGLDARALAAVAPENQFLAIARAMEGIGSQSDRVRLAMKLFDSEGVALLQTMEGGADGIRRMAEEADRLGLTLSDSVVDSMADANDAFARFNAASIATQRSLATYFGPTLGQIADFLGNVLPDGAFAAARALVYLRAESTGALGIMAEGLARFYDVLGNIPGVLGETYQGAADNVRGFATAISDLADSYLDEFRSMTFESREFHAALADSTEIQSLFGASLDATTTAAVKTSAAVKEAEKAMVALAQQGEAVRVSVRTPMESLAEEMVRLDSLLGQGVISWETYARAVIQATDTADNALRGTIDSAAADIATLDSTTERVGQSFTELGGVMTSAFEDAVIDGGDLSDILKGLEKDIARVILRASITDPFSSWFSSIDFGGIFGGLFGGARAGGGPVSSGSTYLVGEQGPELFTPARNGSIIPNDMLGVGGSTPVVNFNISAVDGTSVQRMLMEQRPTIVGLIRDSFSRTGQRVSMA